MLAKSWKVAEDTALPTKSQKPTRLTDGETASTKRTQGTGQAAGKFATSLKLKQLRKSLDADVDLLTLQGRPHQTTRLGKRGAGPSESSKIVAWSERSDK